MFASSSIISVLYGLIDETTMVFQIVVHSAEYKISGDLDFLHLALIVLDVEVTA
jgi:hypothetical protein